MKDTTVLCADIAKNVFQCVIFKNGHQSGANKAYKRDKFERLLRTTEACVVVMENCTGAQHWARVAQRRGHQVILLAPRFVARFRQGQKTDANDALAIFDAYNSAQMQACPLKDVERQGLQTLERTRRHYQRKKTALSNAIRGHLAEFGMIMPKGYKVLKTRVPGILEDADNDLPYSARLALMTYFDDWQYANAKHKELALAQSKLLRSMQAGRELQKLEGVGPVCAAGLLCALGDGRQFSSAKQAGAFIGTAPKQHSSGGKEVMIGISKSSGHKGLRSALIQGARSVILKLKRTTGPRSEREVWLAQLVERVGENRAAVALANKNVRTAWALIAHGRDYQPNH